MFSIDSLDWTFPKFGRLQLVRSCKLHGLRWVYGGRICIQKSSLPHFSRNRVTPEVNTAAFCYGTTRRHCDIFDEEDSRFLLQIFEIRMATAVLRSSTMYLPTLGVRMGVYVYGCASLEHCKVLAVIFDVAKPSTWNCICDTVRTVGWIELRGWPGNRLRSDHQNSFRLTSMHREYESRRNEADNWADKFFRATGGRRFRPRRAGKAGMILLSTLCTRRRLPLFPLFCSTSNGHVNVAERLSREHLAVFVVSLECYVFKFAKGASSLSAITGMRRLG